MGCLFACFRFKDDEQGKDSIISNSIASKNTGVLASKNQLASMFLREEDGSPCDMQFKHLSSKDEIDGDGFEAELKHEAKFLKSCGALLETPAEIRKASAKTAAKTFDEGLLSSDLHSWLPVESCKKLLWEEKPDKTSPSPGQVNESSSLSVKTSECCKSEKDHHDRAFPSIISSKFVHFEDDKQVFVVKSGPNSVALDTSPADDENWTQPSGSKHSPYPTPLKLTDEMQTPGTVYPYKTENLGAGKNARIRTQYVFPTLNPVENVSQWQMLKQPSHQLGSSSERIPDGRENAQQSPLVSGFSGSRQLSSPSKEEVQDSNGTCKEEHCNSPRSVVPPFHAREVAEVNADDGQLVISSLSQWLKPPPTRGSDTSAIMKETSYSKRSPKGDRPILGTVAAHWTDDDPTRISPKWWDGNGIPNSTTKYKEDQKVSWHATPFEERLEKALSDEKLFPERKLLNGKPIKFDEDEGDERDTAAS